MTTSNSTPTVSIYSKRNENTRPHDNTNMHSSTIYNSQKGETTQVSTDKTQNVHTL